MVQTRQKARTAGRATLMKSKESGKAKSNAAMEQYKQFLARSKSLMKRGGNQFYNTNLRVLGNRLTTTLSPSGGNFQNMAGQQVSLVAATPKLFGGTRT